MQALQIASGGLSFTADHPRPVPGPGEVLIRVVLAGICSTDLEMVKGYAGFTGIPGHEFVGVVEDDTTGRWLARRVVGSINVGCRRCEACRAGGAAHCPGRTALGIIGRDGVFADYLVLPSDNLYEVPPEVADEEAVFTEPLAAAIRIREQVRIPPSAGIAVLGPGRLGLLAAQVLRTAGGEVTVFGRRRESLRLPQAWKFPIRLIEEAVEDGFDLVVEATGRPEGLAAALRLVRPLGRVVLKSTFHGGGGADLTGVVRKEISLTGSRCGPFAPALRMLQRGEVRVREMIEACYPLSEAAAAFEHAARPGVRKVLIRPGGR